MKVVKRYSFAILMAVSALLLIVVFPEKQGMIVTNILANVREMVSIVPAIFILMGLADVYVPRETVVKYMGEESALIGAFLAILLGCMSAGPLYAAFPIASMMLRKGASFFNVMVFLGAFSTLRVPMGLFEITSLGAPFAVTRWGVSMAMVLMIAAIINAVVPSREKDAIVARQTTLQVNRTR